MPYKIGDRVMANHLAAKHWDWEGKRQLQGTCGTIVFDRKYDGCYGIVFDRPVNGHSWPGYPPDCGWNLMADEIDPLPTHTPEELAAWEQYDLEEI